MARVEWLGHACFLIEDEGRRVIIDPFQRRGLKYPEIHTSADVLLISHDHFDHNNARAVSGNPVIVKSAGEIERPVKVKAISAFHDRSHGSERGTTLIFRIEVDGMSIVHLGDLGELPSGTIIEQLGVINVLLVPVGGVFTIDHVEATKLVDLLRPNIAIPMHYKTEFVEWTLDPVDKFLKGKGGVKRFTTNAVELSKKGLPEPTEIWVLSPPK